MNIVYSQSILNTPTKDDSNAFSRDICKKSTKVITNWCSCKSRGFKIISRRAPDITQKKLFRRIEADMSQK